MQVCQFTAAQRPVLLQNEVLIQVQSDVGIYEGDVKLDEYQQGRLYLTSHRIIYIDTHKASCFQLEHIQKFETKSGFLTQSPKIILSIQDTTSTFSPQQKPLMTWICSICSESNTNDTTKCQLCGIIQQVTQTTFNTVKTCSTCTFDNHVDLNTCEMCGSNLDASQDTPTVSTTRQTLFMLSFRKGGMTEFAKSLGQALAQKAWIPTSSPSIILSPKPTTLSIGISGIVQQVDQSQKVVHQTMSQAFTDLDALIQKAAEMVKLAESITSKLTSTSSLDEPEMATFRHYLVNLGIDNPVTRETAGDAYREELARQLAEFLDRIPCESMMTLIDVYCLFNRARGVALISPDDLYKSCLLFDKLGLGYHLRTFDSGLLCIQSYILFQIEMK